MPETLASILGFLRRQSHCGPDHYWQDLLFRSQHQRAAGPGHQASGVQPTPPGHLSHRSYGPGVSVQWRCYLEHSHFTVLHLSCSTGVDVGGKICNLNKVLAFKIILPVNLLIHAHACPSQNWLCLLSETKLPLPLTPNLAVERRISFAMCSNCAMCTVHS